MLEDADDGLPELSEGVRDDAVLSVDCELGDDSDVMLRDDGLWLDALAAEGTDTDDRDDGDDGDDGVRSESVRDDCDDGDTELADVGDDAVLFVSDSELVELALS